MPRYALLIAYDGREFSGWWRQRGRRSVASELDAALHRLGERGQAVGASRTDTGVHAMGQVAHVDLERSWEPEQLRPSLDGQLPPDCSCRGIAAVSSDFHAVHDSIGKTYRYRCDLQPERSPFLAASSWRPAQGVDRALAQQAAELWLGEQDLRALLAAVINVIILSALFVKLAGPTSPGPGPANFGPTALSSINVAA